MVVALILLAAASVFVYSLPGLAWFALARADLAGARARHRAACAWTSTAVARRRAPPPRGRSLAVAHRGRRGGRLLGRPALGVRRQGRAGPGVRGQAQLAGVPGRGAGIWPEGDFRVVRGDVSGAYPALALGLAGRGDRRRRRGPPPRLGPGGDGRQRGDRLRRRQGRSPRSTSRPRRSRSCPRWSCSRPSGPLLPPREATRLGTEGMRGAGRVHATLASAESSRSPAPPPRSSRCAPRPSASTSAATSSRALAGLIQGRSVAFLGVDRFSGYWLRGTLMRSPGGYVPSDIQARPKKVWQQGLAMDFDTLSAGRLDEFDYVITTRAGYQSTAAAELQAGRSHRLVRALEAPRADARTCGIIDEDGTPGAVARLRQPPRAAGSSRGVGDRHGAAPSRSSPAARPGAGPRRSTPRGRPPRGSSSARGAGALAPVPQPGAADRLGRRAPGRAAALARRHVPDPPGAGRVLAGRAASRGHDGGPGRRSRSGRRSPAGSSACWASGARCGWGRWPPPGRASAHGAASHDACGRYVDHFTFAASARG